MIIFLYGQDSYRRKEKEKEIIGIYKKKHPYFDFRKFDLQEDNFCDFKDFLNQCSLFENYKLCLVYNFFTQDKQELIKLVKEYLNREDVVLIISNKDCPQGFDFLLAKPIIFQKFEELNSEKLSFFIRKESQKRKINLTLDIIKFLIQISQYFGQEKSWFIINELEKISLFSCKNYLDFKNALSFYSPRENIFYLIRKIDKEDLRTKIVSLEKLFSQIDPAYIFNLLAYQKNLTLRFADYDYLVKSGKMDYETALLDFVLSKS